MFIGLLTRSHVRFNFKRLLSTMETESAKVCCASGKPQGDSYMSLGTELTLNDGELRVYQTGAGHKKGVVLVYDIFGFDIGQTRRFADNLAARESLNVVMPDVFRGRPWRLEDFPPSNVDELIAWMERAGAYSVVEKDLVHVREHLLKTGAVGKPGILGFCWGGKMATIACQSDLYSCGVSVHGAGLTNEMIDKIQVPMMFLPAGDDPCLDSAEKLIQSKPIGKDCVFYRFVNMIHGFAAARGNWNDPKTQEEIIRAQTMSSHFLNKFIG